MTETGENRASAGPWWWNRPRSAVLDIVLAAISAVECAAQGSDFARQVGIPAVLAVVLGVIVGATLVLRRRWPIAVVLVGIAVTPAEMGVMLGVVGLYTLAASEVPRRITGLLAGMTAVGTLLIVVIRLHQSIGQDPTYNPSSWFVPLMAVLMSVGMTAPSVFLGLYVGARRRLVESLRERADGLERELSLLADRAEERAEWARNEERTRIAREMHDVVAHRVSLMVVHAAALQAVALKDPEKASRNAALVGDMGRQALNELRTMLGVLRSGDGDGSGKAGVAGRGRASADSDGAGAAGSGAAGSGAAGAGASGPGGSGSGGSGDVAGSAGSGSAGDVLAGSGAGPASGPASGSGSADSAGSGSAGSGPASGPDPSVPGPARLAEFAAAAAAGSAVPVADGSTSGAAREDGAESGTGAGTDSGTRPGAGAGAGSGAASGEAAGSVVLETRAGVRASEQPEVPEAPTLAKLDVLVGQSRAAGMAVDLSVEGKPEDCPLPVEQTAYRVVQEALTNVHKHAAGARTRVRVAHREAEVALQVENEPVPADGDGVADARLPSGGNGLVGMRERVTGLGGGFVSGPTDAGGFRVSAIIPYAPR